MPRPDMSLNKDGPQIRSPSISGPPQDLLQESPVGLHRGAQSCSRANLRVSVPAMRDHPSRQELVVTGVKFERSVPAPKVFREAVEELRVLQDDGAVSRRATR